MGTEDSNRLGATPFASPMLTPFSSSRPMAGSEASVFRPVPPPSSQFSTPSSSSGLSKPPPPSSYGPTLSGFQRFPSPPMQSAVGQPPPMGSQTSMLPQVRAGPSPIPYGSSQPQQSPIPMGSPPHTIKAGQAGQNIPPPIDGPLSSSRPSFQSSFRPGIPPPQPVQSSPFPSQIGGYTSPIPPTPFSAQPRGYVSGPPTTTPTLYSGNQVHQHGIAPPTTGSQTLAEDFKSLSLGSAPGSLDTGLDTAALPRPLDGDVVPRTIAAMYPMNCNSRYLRLTTSGLPNSQSLACRWHLPLGAIVCPLAEVPAGEDDVPLLNFVTTGIIRCRRCRTYINPYVAFTDNGRKWRCNICSLLNDVPGEYFAQLDVTGRRIDLDQRPELIKGSVEYIAPAEYMVRPPMPPLYFFLIDVSIFAVQSGMLEVMAQTVKSCLDNLPGSPRTQIGFITYDSTIHFYNMKSSLTQPQMMVVSDLDDVFAPLPDDLLVNLSESRSVVEAFLDSLPSMFQENTNVESAFGPALKAAFMIMSQLGGKLLIFQSTLPSLGVGRLKLRGEDTRVYGTDKEHILRVPEDPFYKQMAADLTKYQIAVNVYAFSDKYMDVASLGTLAKYTGGQVYYYPSFRGNIHKDKLTHELTRDLTRETAWEAVMRIRCGKGVRFGSYHGNFMLRSTDLLALPGVDCDKAYAALLSLEETLLTTQTVYFQVALLYTSSSGERRIRVHTAAAPVVSDLGEMYRFADTGAIISVVSRLAIEKTLSSKLEDARNAVQMWIVKALKEYRNLYAVQHRLSGRMIYPESLELLPLYGLALCKSTALRGGYADVLLDERCATGFTMMALPVKRLLKLLYPSLMRVDDYLVRASQFGDTNTAKRLPLTAQSLDTNGLYILDDGFRYVIWFGRSVSPDIAQNLVGGDFDDDYSKVVLAPRDNEMSSKLMKMLSKFRESDQSYYQLCNIVRQGEHPREGYFLLANLVEDQVGGANGYGDWMVLLSRQIQSNA